MKTIHQANRALTIYTYIFAFLFAFQNCLAANNFPRMDNCHICMEDDIFPSPIRQIVLKSRRVSMLEDCTNFLYTYLKPTAQLCTDLEEKIHNVKFYTHYDLTNLPPIKTNLQKNPIDMITEILEEEVYRLLGNDDARQNASLEEKQQLKEIACNLADKVVHPLILSFHTNSQVYNRLVQLALSINKVIDKPDADRQLKKHNYKDDSNYAKCKDSLSLCIEQAYICIRQYIIMYLFRCLTLEQKEEYTDLYSILHIDTTHPDLDDFTVLAPSVPVVGLHTLYINGKNDKEAGPITVVPKALFEILSTGIYGCSLKICISEIKQVDLSKNRAPLCLKSAPARSNVEEPLQKTPVFCSSQEKILVSYAELDIVSLTVELANFLLQNITFNNVSNVSITTTEIQCISTFIHSLKSCQILVFKINYSNICFKSKYQANNIYIPSLLKSPASDVLIETLTFETPTVDLVLCMKMLAYILSCANVTTTELLTVPTTDLQAVTSYCNENTNTSYSTMSTFNANEQYKTRTLKMTLYISHAQTIRNLVHYIYMHIKETNLKRIKLLCLNIYCQDSDCHTITSTATITKQLGYCQLHLPYTLTGVEHITVKYSCCLKYYDPAIYTNSQLVRKTALN
ncbi:hypothetical protein NEOKW01_1344 [Nematocida sp. AWRm80]|nr:hypothetical protein NEOKW01_1344 [Nematocida sp. AWRm80]